MRDGSGQLGARARALLELNRHDEAESLARQALAADPDNARLHSLLARALLNQERFGESRAEAERALALQPDDLDGLAILSASANGLGDRRVATAAVGRLVELAPAWDAAHRQRASVLLSTGKPQDALLAADRAVTLNPSAAANYSVQAAVLADLRRYAEARVAVAKALALDPQHQHAHKVAGRLALREGNSESEDRFREALRLDPSDRSARAGMNVAIKARNPIYRMLIAFGAWHRGQQPFVRGLVSFSPFILAQIARGIHTQPAQGIVLGVAASIFLLSWTLSPILALAMLASPRDRVFVDSRERRSSLAFLGFVVSAMVCFVIVATTHHKVLIPAGFGFVLWAFAAGAANSMPTARERRLAFLALVAVLAGIACGACAFAGADKGAVPFEAIVFLTGIVAVWYVVLGSRQRFRIRRG